MKKIYYKVSSFFTEKRSTIILLLMVLSILFIPKNTYALDFSQAGTSTFNQELVSIMDYAFNYDNLLYSTCGTGNTSYFYFCPLHDNTTYQIGPQGNYNNTLKYNNNPPNNSYVSMNCFRTRNNYLNLTPIFNYQFIYATSAIQNMGTLDLVNGGCTTYSSIDIKDENNNIIISKSFDYSPPSSNCPTCEECQECEEGGPVEVSNFPFDKTDFYTLLVLIGILIIMLFLKWCFPMKGGKNNK